MLSCEKRVFRHNNKQSSLSLIAKNHKKQITERFPAIELHNARGFLFTVCSAATELASCVADYRGRAKCTTSLLHFTSHRPRSPYRRDSTHTFNMFLVKTVTVIAAITQIDQICRVSVIAANLNEAIHHTARDEDNVCDSHTAR